MSVAMKDSIDKLITRTRQTFYSDGLWELVAGCISLCGGLLLQISPNGNRGAMVFVACVLVIFLLYSVLKNNLVYPRSGYAVYKGQGLRAHIIAVVRRAVLLAALTGVFITIRTQINITEQAWLVLFLGIFIGAGWLWQGIRLRITRLLLLGVLSLFLGTILSPLLGLAAAQGMNIIDRLSWYFLFLGAGFLASGGITFWKYLRSPRQDGDETA